MTAGPDGFRGARPQHFGGLVGPLHEPGCPRSLGRPIHHHAFLPSQAQPVPNGGYAAMGRNSSSRRMTAHRPQRGRSVSTGAAGGCRPRGDARHLVRQRHRHDQARPPGEQRPQPRVGLDRPGPAQHRLGADDQEPAQLGIAPLADLAQARLAAARVLPRHQSEPGREFPPAAEGGGVGHRRRQGAGGHRPDPRDRRQPLAGRAGAMPRQQLPADHGQPGRELLELLDERRQDPTRQRGHPILGLVPDGGDQLHDMARALGRDDAELGQMAPQRVDQPCRATRPGSLRERTIGAADRGPLTHQQITGAMDGQRRLLLLRLDRHKAHRRAGHRLADRRGIGRIVLVALEIGLDVLRRHQPHLVPERTDLTRPVVRRGTSLDPDQASGQTGKEAQDLAAPQRLAHHDLARAIDCVHLKHLLSQIEADRGNLAHGWLP